MDVGTTVRLKRVRLSLKVRGFQVGDVGSVMATHRDWAMVCFERGEKHVVEDADLEPVPES